MALFITSLNSGSNGNCYYVGNENEAVLIDAGISCRETEKRMKNLGLSMSKVKAILVSHEHTDHIRGIPVLSAKYSLPVFCTPPTLRNSKLKFPKHLLRELNAAEPILIGQLAITAFRKLHDAIDPHSFIVSGSGVTVGVFTDIGAACENLTHYFKLCHAAFFGSNYDHVMLENGRYPAYLKHRIRGGLGHLSNMQALNFFLAHRPGYMSHLVLSHLSKENNCPELVQELFDQHAGNTQIIVASRYKETPVFTIGQQTQRPMPAAPRMLQTSLFT
jgi:phosphoribosyl 1,2-cyclic phosphodiesterase